MIEGELLNVLGEQNELGCNTKKEEAYSDCWEYASTLRQTSESFKIVNYSLWSHNWDAKVHDHA